MASGDDISEPKTNRTDSPSILFLAPGSSEAETMDTALSRHEISVSVSYDIAQTLETLTTTTHECLVVPDTLTSIACREFFETIREQDPSFPVVFLLSETNDDLEDQLENVETAAFVRGTVESVSYDRLADRIRTVSAAYRTTQARRTERDIVERLQDRINRTERKITALHRVAMDLNTVSTVDEVYEETVHAAEIILNLDICFVFTAEEDVFVPKAQSSTPTDRELSPVSLDAGAMGETYRTGDSFRAVDMDLHALAAPEFGEYQSGLSVPIGDFGVFQAVSKAPGRFDEIDLELTELLTTHAAAVLQRLSFEKQLRIERDRYAALFENSTDCILEAEFVDDTSIIRRVNPAFEAVFGYPESEITGCAVDDVVVSEDRREEARKITERVHNGEFVQTEVRRQTSDGIRDFLLRSVPVTEETLYAVYTDITEQKESKRMIEQQNERLGAFASTVSHDLKNPLFSAQGRLELAREAHDPERNDDDFDAVARAHSRIEALIEDLLTLAREGHRALTIEPVSLASVVEFCWKTVETADASLVVETERTIHADEGQLRQLMENLIRNAIEHGGADVTLTVGDLGEGFYVEDDGAGIPSDEWEKVFDAGYSTSTEGTGLGLRIVKQASNAHNWKVTVTDGTDGGARFEFTDVEFEQ